MDSCRNSIQQLFRMIKYGFCLAFFVANSHAETINYLVIGSNVAPLQYDVNSGKRGIIGTILDDVAKPFGLTTRQLPWPRQLEQIKQGTVSNWVIYASKGWLDFPAKFSAPLFDWKHILIRTKNTDADSDSLVLVKNFDYPNLEKWMTTNSFDKVYFAPSPKSALTMLKKGRAQIYIGEIARIKHAMKDLDMRFEDYAVKSFSSYIPDDQIFLAFDPSVNDETIEIIDARISKMKKEGLMKAILADNDWSSSIPLNM